MNSTSLALLVLTLLIRSGAGHVPTDLLSRILYDEPNDQLQKLAQITDASDSTIARTFFSPAHKKAAQQIAAWMQRAGLRTWVDNIGNVHGRIEGRNKRAPALLLGSHYDTVHDGGAYDGALGIIAAIAAVKALLLDAVAVRNGVDVAALARSARPSTYVNVEDILDERGALLDAPVEVVAFSDEEGVRFQTTFLGSSALAGTLVPKGGLEAQDKRGRSVAQVLQDNNFPGTPESVEDVAMRQDQVAGYVEVHLEQGPVLEVKGAALGVVDSIAGQNRLAVSVVGSQGHAGTVPMALRHDAMAGAAALIHGLEALCSGRVGEVATDSSLVCTVGKLDIWPGASNVIPGSANFTVDIRSRSDEMRLNVVSRFEADVHAACAERGLLCTMEVKHAADTVTCDADIVRSLAAAVMGAEEVVDAMAKFKQCAEEEGGHAAACASRHSPRLPQAPDSCTAEGEALRCGEVEVPVMTSGAGHDAMAVAKLTKVGMMFVRCDAGISHSPSEKVEPGDVSAAAAALYTYLRQRTLASAVQEGKDEL